MIKHYVIKKEGKYLSSLFPIAFMKAKTIGQFTVTQNKLNVSIKPGTCMFMVAGKELRNGETEYNCVDMMSANYAFDKLVKYAEQNKLSLDS